MDVSIEVPVGFIPCFPTGIVFFLYPCYDTTMNAYLLYTAPLKGREEEYLPLLPLERQRKVLACAQEEDRLLSLGAGLLLYRVLGVQVDSQLEVNPYGAPRLSAGSPFFSLSHSGEYALLAVSDAPVGADIQLRKPLRTNLLSRIATQEEMASNMDFFTLFTRKEAMMKASALGFSLFPKSFSVLEPFVYEGQAYHFFTLDRGEYVLSFATQEKQPPTVQEPSLQDMGI